MRRVIWTTLAAAAAVTGMAGQANAVPQPVVACAITDITPNAVACQGYFAGNQLNNSPADVAAHTAALLALGLVYDGTPVEIISGLNGSHTVDFAALLVGTVYFGVHHGNGQGGPGNGTAYYKLNAGAGLDQITLLYNASSNAWLFDNGTPPPPPPVPEPGTWAMMLVGFGAAGAAMRRRKRREGEILQVA